MKFILIIGVVKNTKDVSIGYMDIAILLIFIVVLLAYFVFITMQLYYSVGAKRAPFVPTTLKVVALPLIQVLEGRVSRPQKTIFYELGAGRASISKLVGKHFDLKQIIAIEINPILVFINTVEQWIFRNNITLLRKDLLEYKYEKGSVLYCYLFPALLQKLFDAGAFEGQLVVCLTFPIKNLTPTQSIPLSNYQKQLFVYDLR
jgi:hypothetical protein